MAEPRRKNIVWLRLLYDAFEPDTVETHELKWRRGVTVADYLEGLPPEAEWMVFVNGQEIDPATNAGMVLDRGDQLGLILVPQGGGGFKSVLRIVLQAAAVALAFVPGIGWAAALAINVGIGLVNAFLLTPKPPKQNSGDTSNSYGIDGAKNSATEGIPYPVIFGEFRTAGNFSDCYTVNVGDVQYLYLRAILNDGLIDSVRDIEINEQPIANFTDVETRVALGSLTQGVNDWFQNSIVQFNKSQKLGTDWLTHETSSAVDKVRFDVVFTNGLVTIDEKKGTYKNRSVTFQMEVQKVDPVTGNPTGPWVPAASGNNHVSPDLNGDGHLSLNEILYARLMVKANAEATQVSQNQNQRLVSSNNLDGPGVLYREVGAEDWSTFGQVAPVDYSYAYDPSGDGSLAGATDITPQANAIFEADLAPGSYEFMPVNGAEIVQVASLPSSENLTRTITDKRTRQIRHSFETGRLEKAYYRARIRRTTPTSTDQYQIDEVYLSDVAEIEVDQVAQVGTASLSLKIKLTEQLNSIPQLTALVRGSVCQTYDIDGNPLGEKWTRNPAWHGLDLLCGPQRGVGYKLSRIDWPRWIEFAEYCETNNLFFNGEFVEGSNSGDVLNGILRIGHAAPVPFGTKISVAIDRKRDPVAFFGPGNILKDSFEVSYLSVADRANEYEVTYYDRLDRNKAKTIRYVDPKAVRFNETPRQAQVPFPGIDNIEQARTELWRMIYANRLLMRTITFDSFMDSINLALGECALIQHDQMAWAVGGRLDGGSTATKLKLDFPVEVEEGKNYAALVHFDALSRGSWTVSSVVGRKVLVTGPSVAGVKASRALVGGGDYEIVAQNDGGSYHTITLASAPQGVAQGQTLELWDTDVVVEVPVSQGITSSTRELALGQALPGAPAALANWVFGEVKNVRKPFALTGVSGTGIEKRKLTFVEYHEGVYGPAEVEIPIPVQSLSDRNVQHVTGLMFDYERLVAADRKTINARVHWSAAGIRNYAGADVYMSLNGEAFRALAPAVNMTEATVTLNEGDVPDFKVVAYNKRGDRAPFKTAPSVRGTIAVIYAELDAPKAVDVAVVQFQVDGRAQVSVTPPDDMTGVEGFELEYRKVIDDDWTSTGSTTGLVTAISGLETGTFLARARSVSPTGFSEWVEKQFAVSVRPGSIMANFLSSNDRNSDPIPNPVTRPNIDVDHVLNSDGSADVSFEWEWGGEEATIDGFEVKVEILDA